MEILTAWYPRLVVFKHSLVGCEPIDKGAVSFNCPSEAAAVILISPAMEDLSLLLTALIIMPGEFRIIYIVI